jgi:hypothetical protein
MHVEADDILDLLGKSRIGGALESAQAMRLQAVGAPVRCTVCSARPTVLAIARPVQWVISPGGSPQVNASTLLTVSIAIGFLPGARVLSRSRPATPASAYRRCQRHTAGRLTPARPATCSTGRRSAESRTMRARCTCFTGRVRSPMIASKRTRSSSLTTTQSSWAIRLDTISYADDSSVSVNALAAAVSRRAQAGEMTVRRRTAAIVASGCAVLVLGVAISFSASRADKPSTLPVASTPAVPVVAAAVKSGNVPIYLHGNRCSARPDVFSASRITPSIPAAAVMSASARALPFRRPPWRLACDTARRFLSWTLARRGDR